jgi:hypothetical protein
MTPEQLAETIHFEEGDKLWAIVIKKPKDGVSELVRTNVNITDMVQIYAWLSFSIHDIELQIQDRVLPKQIKTTRVMIKEDVIDEQPTNNDKLD